MIKKLYLLKGHTTEKLRKEFPDKSRNEWRLRKMLK